MVVSGSSYNAAATAITPASASALTHDWTWAPPAPTKRGQPAGLEASPTVVNGVVYIGANTGTFYALNESTGKVLWSQFLGYVTQTTCGPLGIVATATVEPPPGGGPLTVYVAGGDGYLYALDAATGAVDWKSVIGIPSTTVNDYFDWSSPTVVNGNIYVGVASNCDAPLVSGGLKEQRRGRRGGPECLRHEGKRTGRDSVSVVRLNAATLTRQDAWAIPTTAPAPDSDFGGSPRSSRPSGTARTCTWPGTRRRSTASATRDRSRWSTGHGRSDLAARHHRAADRVADNGRGRRHCGHPVRLRHDGQELCRHPPHAATGAVLNSINIGPDFGQPVFADNKMLVPSQNRGLIVYSPPRSPARPPASRSAAPA